LRGGAGEDFTGQLSAPWEFQAIWRMSNKSAKPRQDRAGGGGTALRRFGATK